MDDPRRWQRLLDEAARRNNVITPRLIRESGLARSTYYDFAHRFGAEWRHRGVWTVPNVDFTYLTQSTAALAAIGMPAMLTGAAALHLLGVQRHRPTAVTVLVPAGRNPGGHRRIEVIRTPAYEEIRSVQVGGIPLAQAERALLDVSRSAGVDPLARLMAAACRPRLTDLPLLVERTPASTFRGKRAWNAALSALHGEMVHSNPERIARVAVAPYELGFEPRPFVVLRGTRPLAEIDLAIPAIKYGLEIDGPHHLLEQQQRQDEERDRELRDDGWRIDRVLWDTVLADPQAFARKIARTVAAVRRQQGVTPPEPRAERAR
jgi:hypothetical protein